MSQEAVAAEAGINRVTLARLELALHEPTLDTLARIAQALGATLRVEIVEPRARRKGGN
ncbi:MAG: helix-turn-helix transcriptional regulator [Candidatus Rokubacteria bacterium]|nr:helix-turn-helix transcriptional regulator [Candidatus Rokubacteria bacterium]